MTSPEPPPSPRPEAAFFAWMLIVIGALLVVLCGGCTLALWVGGIFMVISPHTAAMGPGLIAAFFTTLLIGGLPAAGGAVLVWAGRRRLQPIKTPRTVAKTFE
jgi:hypothetical protein